MQRNIDDQAEDEEDDFTDEEDEARPIGKLTEKSKEEEKNKHGVQKITDNKKNLKDIARKLWLSVEVGDKLATLKILQSQT